MRTDSSLQVAWWCFSAHGALYSAFFFIMPIFLEYRDFYLYSRLYICGIKKYRM